MRCAIFSPHRAAWFVLSRSGGLLSRLLHTFHQHKIWLKLIHLRTRRKSFRAGRDGLCM